MGDQQTGDERIEAQTMGAAPSESIPLEQSDLIEKVKDETSGEPLPEKAETGLKELDREVSGTYEAQQDKAAPEKVAEDVEDRR